MVVGLGQRSPSATVLCPQKATSLVERLHMGIHVLRGQIPALLLLAMILCLSVSLALSSTSVSAAPDSYTVRDGDTLFAIAASLGIDSGSQSSWVDSVVQLNSLGSPDRLSVGQQLKLPGSTPASNKTTSS